MHCASTGTCWKARSGMSFMRSFTIRSHAVSRATPGQRSLQMHCVRSHSSATTQKTQMTHALALSLQTPQAPQLPRVSLPVRAWMCHPFLRKRGLAVIVRACLGLLRLIWCACLGFVRLHRDGGRREHRSRTPTPRNPFHPPTVQLPAPEYHCRSRLGPKSEGSRRRRRISPRAVSLRFIVICMALFGITPAMSARVATDSTPAAGAHASVDPDRSLQQAAKPSGTPDIPASFHTCQETSLQARWYVRSLRDVPDTGGAL